MIGLPFNENPPVGEATTPGIFLIASKAVPELTIGLSLTLIVVLSDSTLMYFFLSVRTTSFKLVIFSLKTTSSRVMEFLTAVISKEIIS